MTAIDVQMPSKRVEVGDGMARLVDGDTVVEEREVKQLPEKFVQWQLDYKRGVYDAIERDEYVAFNVGHLPVVGTWSGDSPVPNLANKGIGFTPRTDYLNGIVASRLYYR